MEANFDAIESLWLEYHLILNLQFYFPYFASVGSSEVGALARRHTMPYQTKVDH
jgi:hypothetical protein